MLIPLFPKKLITTIMIVTLHACTTMGNDWNLVYQETKATMLDHREKLEEQQKLLINWS